MFYLMVLLAALKLRAQTVHFALSFIPHVKQNHEYHHHHHHRERERERGYYLCQLAVKSPKIIINITTTNMTALI